MKLKPLRDYSEHDVIPFFALDTATGAKGTLVKVAGSGFINNAAHGIAYNLNSSTKNVYTPRWEVKAKVTRTSSGEYPLGFILYDVKETSSFGTPYMHDPQRKLEAQCVVSGEGNPIVRKGLFMVGDLPTGGLHPLPGRVVVQSTTEPGQWAVAAAGTAGAFGVFLGAYDSDNYALVSVDFNNVFGA